MMRKIIFLIIVFALIVGLKNGVGVVFQGTNFFAINEGYGTVYDENGDPLENFPLSMIDCIISISDKEAERLMEKSDI